MRVPESSFMTGGDIDGWSEELNQLYFSSANDENEGGLRTWRRDRGRRPAEKLHQFNASFMVRRDGTVSFMSHKLTDENDDLYPTRTTRKQDESRPQKKLKIAQMQANFKEKDVENRQKEVQREERRENKAAKLG